MKKILLAFAAIATVAGAAAPAAAAPMNINQREADIAQRIDRSVRNHVISPREAQGLRSQLAAIERIEQRYRRGGLNRVETRDLDRRLDQLAAQVRTERRDRDGRPDRDGRWDRDGRDGRHG